MLEIEQASLRHRIDRVLIYKEEFSQLDWASYIAWLLQCLDSASDAAEEEHREHIISLEDQINELIEEKNKLHLRLERIKEAMADDT